MKHSYRIDELAKEWDCSDRTVRRLIENGKLDAFRLSRSYRISTQAKQEFEKNLKKYSDSSGQ